VVKTRKPLNLLRLRALEKIFVTNYLVKKAIFRGNCVTKSSRACPTIRPTIRCNTIFCPTMSHNYSAFFFLKTVFEPSQCTVARKDSYIGSSIVPP